MTFGRRQRIVILSGAKDLVYNGNAAQILGFAQDDRQGTATPDAFAFIQCIDQLYTILGSSTTISTGPLNKRFAQPPEGLSSQA